MTTVSPPRDASSIEVQLTELACVCEELYVEHLMVPGRPLGVDPVDISEKGKFPFESKQRVEKVSKVYICKENRIKCAIRKEDYIDLNF